MDKGALMVARILIAGVVLGFLVMIFYPAYRKTAQAIFHGQPESSPIWLANERYYPAVRFTSVTTP
jgi:hypothetical protein